MVEMQERPLVTFLLIAYNQEPYIAEAVAGALSQTYEPLEIILSDDCSSDRTYEIMQKMASDYKGPHCVKVRRSMANLGLARHSNELMDVSSGEIITWCAGDDIADSTRTDELVAPLINDKEVIGSHSGIREIDSEGNFIRYRYLSEQKMGINIENVIRHGTSIVSQSHACRKVVFTIFGKFREDLTNEGMAMAFREASLGKVVFIDKPLTSYRVGVGISTYSGKDVSRVKSYEPIKITGWYLYSFRQMLDDSRKIPNPIAISDIKLIERNIKFCENIMNINIGKNVTLSLLRNFVLIPWDIRPLKAAVRSLIPDRLYKIYLTRR